MSVLTLASRGAPVVPLVARGALLSACALLAALAFGPDRAVGTALLLLAVAAVASLPFTALPPLAQPLLEIVLIAGLLGAVGERGTPFLPYLTVPALVVGLSLGIRLGLAVALVGSLTLFATSLVVVDPVSDQTSTLVQNLQWSLLALAVAALAGWSKRLRQGEVGAPEAAYVEAYRLLSELHIVAGQLSLGLDTSTLASALCRDLAAVTGSAENLVAIRGQTGIFHRLTGSGDLPVGEVELSDAWLSGEPVVAAGPAGTHLVLPVRMGDRVVALTMSALGPAAAHDPHLVSLASKAVDRSGSRLASAMLFDEVRHLATQDERLRLARDIHDGIAQDVASLGFFVDDAMHGADEVTAVKLKALRGELRKIVSELRLSIFDLRLAADEAITLGTAIGDHTRRVGTLAGLQVHVSIEESSSRLTSAAEHEIMRIAQESMTNVRRHAQATNLWVECHIDAPSFLLRIEDDGSGLGPSTDASMGLKGIRERTARLGGSVTVQDRAQGGTIVEVTSKPPMPSAGVASLRVGHV